MVPVLAAALFGLVACSNSTPGTATTTGGDQTTTAGAGDTTSSSSSGSDGSPLASVQPCDLVTSSALSQLGLSGGQTSTQAGARICQWQTPVDQNGNNGAVAGVEIRDHQGLSDVVPNGYTTTTKTLGSHQAEQLRSKSSGDCIDAIGVSDHSRVDVTVS
ncbi:MAG TPA: DUF3558 family protein, partial [Pseudonocardiaceae bacterium]|nr:DUF3558 family protein [Pseudonocardiaceae bacterium]